MTARWDPELYLTHADERERPCRDLLARVDVDDARRVADLGCGPGNSTSMLARRWPDAEVTGVDTSEEMLVRARERLPAARFASAPIEEWSGEGLDVVFSNAALHWVDDHATLLPRLLGSVRPGGQLAVQMPRNHDAATHRLLFETLDDAPWRGRLAGVARRESPVASPSGYVEMLAPLARRLDLWETEYHHRLASVVEIVEWMRGAAMRPFLDALSPEEGEALSRDYGSRLARAYRPDVDGRVTMPFRRLFMVVTTG